MTQDINENYIFDGAGIRNVERRAQAIIDQEKQNAEEETEVKLPPTTKAKKELEAAGFDPTKEEFAGMTVAQAREYIKSQQVEEDSPVKRQQSIAAREFLTQYGQDPDDEKFAGFDILDARQFAADNNLKPIEGTDQNVTPEGTDNENNKKDKVEDDDRPAFNQFDDKEQIDASYAEEDTIIIKDSNGRAA